MKVGNLLFLYVQVRMKFDVRFKYFDCFDLPAKRKQYEDLCYDFFFTFEKLNKKIFSWKKFLRELLCCIRLENPVEGLETQHNPIRRRSPSVEGEINSFDFVSTLCHKFHVFRFYFD